MAGQRTDLTADVVVIGFGAAGACAALEAAAAGASVLIIERFTGGGATELSGGVVYAGGGTPQQAEAGVTDTPGCMFDYLAAEVGDAVTPATLKAFCEQSAEMIAWLSGHGVPFAGSLCPDKTSYPSNRHYLYYSGSEHAFADLARPAPRGHRAVGRGTSGKVLYRALAAAVARAGVTVVPQTTARGLVTDWSGRISAVDCLTLGAAPYRARLAHRALHRVSKKPFLYLPRLGRVLHRRVEQLERRHGRPARVQAGRGVVLAAGGFGANRPMMREHAPAYRGGLALATPGDDGSAIRLGVEAGGATRFLDRVSVWRFLSPPPALLRGVLVDQAGHRFTDESRYGAAIGEAMVRQCGGRAWLLADRGVIAQAWRELRRPMLWFQRAQAVYLLTAARVSGRSAQEIAARAGVDPSGLAVTLAAAGFDRPPYSLIDVSIRPRPAYPAPMLTLGGLVVDEETGQVLREDRSVVGGLFAAGRSAVGLCSNSYISGLSLADCVYSGRRAGSHAAGS